MRRLLLGAAVTLLAFGGPWAPPAHARPTGQTPTPTGDVRDGLGVVRVTEKRASIGWVAGPGVVITPDEFANQVGRSVLFIRHGTDAQSSCYVADRFEHIRLAALRCQSLAGPVIPITIAFPATGTPSSAAFLSIPAAGQIELVTGQIVDNDVRFMGKSRLQFSIPVAKDRGQAITTRNVGGLPVINAEGQAISTLIVAPDEGGPPLGTNPGELRRIVADTARLPAAFPTAAIVSIARRAAIPTAVGAIAGLVWGLLSRNNTLLKKTLGLALVGVLSAVAYSVFMMLVIGPETLIA